MITFKSFYGDGEYHNVYLDGKLVGRIAPQGIETDYQYFPKGQKQGGEVFKTLALCKQSLRG
jgi:hypothetical protein